MRRRYLTAVGVGAAVVWLSQWAWMNSFLLIYGSPNSSYVVLILGEFAFALVLIAPGFCAGWVSRRHGILVGALTGFVGAITYNTVGAPILDLNVRVLDILTWQHIYLGLLAAPFKLVVTCAAGGATAELLRSIGTWRGRDA